MTKEELHEAAEEWIASTFGKRQEKTLDEILPGSVNQFSKDLTAFHLHQTKKMLEGWTDEMLRSAYLVKGIGNKRMDAFEPGDFYRTEGMTAKDFRDELLKQLEG